MQPATPLQTPRESYPRPLFSEPLKLATSLPYSSHISKDSLLLDLFRAFTLVHSPGPLFTEAFSRLLERMPSFWSGTIHSSRRPLWDSDQGSPPPGDCCTGGSRGRPRGHRQWNATGPLPGARFDRWCSLMRAAAAEAGEAAARRDTCLIEKTVCWPISEDYFPGWFDDSRNQWGPSASSAVPR
jgi:hypothetical protein